MSTELLSPNAIYRKICKELPEGMSFKVWIENEKQIHNELIESGRMTPNTDFAVYLNHKLKVLEDKKKSNFSANEILAQAEVVATNALNTWSENKTSELDQKAAAPSEKMILGFKPVVFYSLSAVAVLGVIAGGVLIYKQFKKK